MAENDCCGKGLVMVWAGIASTEKLTALKCCKEILNQFVMPYARAIGSEFILMDDKACPYRAHVTNANL